MLCYACSDSLLLTSLCCDDIHDVTPRASALAGGKFRDHIVHIIGDGCNTSLWFDNWHAICPLRNFISKRDILYSGLSLECKVANVIKNGVWDWPSNLACKFNGLTVIQPPCLIEGMRDKVVWRNNHGRLMDFSVLKCEMILDVEMFWFRSLGLSGSTNVLLDTLSCFGWLFLVDLELTTY
nr:RNA-directed DNA polymerase, eukaryota, reverse transcriptase zinc-binding domain protein [Tanacetum cinerariifolium]